jgi:hypothetical protein
VLALQQMPRQSEEAAWLTAHVRSEDATDPFVLPEEEKVGIPLPTSLPSPPIFPPEEKKKVGRGIPTVLQSFSFPFWGRDERDEREENRKKNSG